MSIDTFALHYPDAMFALSIPMMLATTIGLPLFLMWLALG